MNVTARREVNTLTLKLDSPLHRVSCGLLILRILAMVLLSVMLIPQSMSANDSKVSHAVDACPYGRIG